jgi:CRISPR-associated endonuclease/helicase Cas3
VVWRADLDVAQPHLWPAIVPLCPPVAAEAMAVPLYDFRAWLAGGEGALSSDIQGVGEEEGKEASGALRCPVLRWRGDESYLIEDAQGAAGIRPGDTLVLSVASEGWDELGHIPRDAEKDAAERARFALRRGWVLRLHPEVMKQWPENPKLAPLRELVNDPAVEEAALLDALREYAAQVESPEWLKTIPANVELEAYPGDGGNGQGWVLSQRFAEADAGNDESSASRSVALDDHLANVTKAVEQVADGVAIGEPIRESLVRAALWHDYGKADLRFQALLHGGDPIAAQFAPKLLAKGAQARRSKAVRQAQWNRSGLPDGFRHELLSLAFARQDREAAADELALHLIASHHGRCRPFAPVIEDDGGDVACNGSRLAREERAREAAHRLESGVAERFWSLTRRYGWWGLAYLESLVRLGDWKASKDEAAKREVRA